MKPHCLARGEDDPGDGTVDQLARWSGQESTPLCRKISNDRRKYPDHPRGDMRFGIRSTSASHNWVRTKCPEEEMMSQLNSTRWTI
jgi:hypothetical protein